MSKVKNEEESLYEAADFEYATYIDDIIEIFRRLSLSRQQMCEENLLNNIEKAKTKNRQNKDKPYEKLF